MSNGIPLIMYNMILRSRWTEANAGPAGFAAFAELEMWAATSGMPVSQAEL
jgi:hypothetical protein